MSLPTAFSSKIQSIWSSASCQAPPVKLKTAQRCLPSRWALATATAIASEPGPVNGPQSSCETGFGKSKSFRRCSLTSCLAVAVVQSALTMSCTRLTLEW